MNPKYLSTISELDNLVGLTSRERTTMETVSDTFPFRSNEYYLSLIDWKDGPRSSSQDYHPPCL